MVLAFLNRNKIASVLSRHTRTTFLSALSMNQTVIARGYPCANYVPAVARCAKGFVLETSALQRQYLATTKNPGSPSRDIVGSQACRWRVSSVFVEGASALHLDGPMGAHGRSGIGPTPQGSSGTSAGRAPCVAHKAAGSGCGYIDCNGTRTGRQCISTWRSILWVVSSVVFSSDAIAKDEH